jgi:hypothetical protein
MPESGKSGSRIPKKRKVSPFAARWANKRVAELLAGYVLSAGHSGWPGTDGLTVAEAAGAFSHAAALAGQVPDRAELTRRHPERADAIRAFLSAKRTPWRAPPAICATEPRFIGGA